MRMKIELSRVGTLCLLGLSAISCAYDEKPGAEPEAGESEDPLYVASTKVWSNREHTTSLKVCFEQAGYATERTWVRDAITSSWESAGAGIKFTGWATCSGSASIRIKFQTGLCSDGQSVACTVGMGTDLGNVTNGMSLNTYSTLSCKTGYTREKCVKLTAVHEFGHALGFSHEQNRNDDLPGCPATPQGPNGDVYFGSYDCRSVMNYWNADGKPSNDGVLTNTDIQGLRHFYGPFNVTCNGLASSCSEMNFQKFSSLNRVVTPPYAVDGTASEFTTYATIYQHADIPFTFSSPTRVELPARDLSLDFTGFTTPRAGCVKIDSLSGYQSLAHLSSGSFCDGPVGLGGARYVPRYLSTHHNPEPNQKNAYESWLSAPHANQPITMEVKGANPRHVFNLMRVTVKYGKIDIWTDSNLRNGTLNSTASWRNLGVGTHTVTTRDVTKVVYTAAGAGTGITNTNSGIKAAGIDAVVVGWP